MTETDPQMLLANDTTRMQQLFLKCSDIREISINTGSYVTSGNEGRVLR